MLYDAFFRTIFCFVISFVIPIYCFFRSYRYAAYRQFIWWLYFRLGKGKRRVIPSCVIWTIRECFPESDGLYTLYNEGKHD